MKVESVNSVPSALALLPQRRLPLAGVLLIAGLLSALLGILDGTRSLRLGALVLLLAGCSGGLWSAVRTRQGIQAGLMILAVIVLLQQGRVHLIDITFALIPYGDVAMMLLAVGLVRLPLQQQGLGERVAQLLSRFSPGGRSVALLVGAIALAPVLSMGALSLLGALTSDHVSPGRDAAIAVLRGVMVAMMWAPTFMPVALLLTTFPDASWNQMLAYTVPVAIVAGLILTRMTRAPLEAAGATNAGPWPAEPVAMLLANAVQSIVYIFVLRLPALVAVTLASFCTVVLWACLRPSATPKRVQAIVTLSEEICRRLAPELLLFLSSGAVAVGLSQDAVRHSDVVRSLLTITAVIPPPVFVVMLLPVINLAQIHPIILFTLIAPLLSQEMSTTQSYLSWLAYWCLSLAISPVSIMNLVACTSFRVSMQEIRSHVRPLPYLLAASVIAWGVSNV